MELAAAQWRYSQIHEEPPFHDGTFTKWAKERSIKHPYHALDGVTIWIAESDLTPHDHFLGGKSDCPECSGGGAVDQEQDDSGDQ